MLSSRNINDFIKGHLFQKRTIPLNHDSWLVYRGNYNAGPRYLFATKSIATNSNNMKQWLLLK